MAKYGRGYYTDAKSLLIGMQEGLTEAFEMTCEELVDDIKSFTDVYIYSQPEKENYSPRTGEFRDSIDYTSYSVSNGLQEAIFHIDTSKIQTIDNPFHHVLEMGGTGDDLFNIVSDQHGGMRDDIEFWLRDEFPKKYRANCKALGIELE